MSLCINDLDYGAIEMFSKLTDDEHNKVVVCILCDKCVKVLNTHGVPVLGNIVPLPLLAPPRPPRKQPTSSRNKLPRALIRELQHLATFQCQVFIFTQCEKIGKEDRENRVREHFYGDCAKNLKGVCEQIVDGDHAFQLLYDRFDDDGGSKRRLKNICSGGSSTLFVPSVDFTVSSIAYYSSDKTYAGKSIWDMGLEVHKSLKKALSLLPHLTRIVNVDKTGMVTSFASGKTEKNFYDAICNGMYVMEVAEKKSKHGNDPISEMLEDDREDDAVRLDVIRSAGDNAFNDVTVPPLVWREMHHWIIPLP
jgi:hypothetical protein